MTRTVGRQVKVSSAVPAEVGVGEATEAMCQPFKKSGGTEPPNTRPAGRASARSASQDTVVNLTNDCKQPPLVRT